VASPSRAGFDFNRISIHPGNTGVIQKRSSLNRPGDLFEREADAAASRVMNTAGLAAEKASEATQPSPANTGRPASDKLPGSRGSQGVPLSSHIRAFMEPRFEYDFSRVRVHTDRDAIALSRGLNAQAFTHNEDIFYGEGRSPGVDPLTAHELAHVVQQAGERPLQTPAAGAPTGRDAPPSVQRVPSIRFNYDGLQPNHKWLNNFVSHDHHYQVFQVVAHPDHDIAGGEMFVRTADGRRVSMDDFKAQRDAARGAPSAIHPLVPMCSP
jgi:hypothetical protein